MINHRTKIYDGERFDSNAEFCRYLYLKNQQDKGKISNLECHPEYLLIPSQKTKHETFRAVKYTADFKYIQDGVEIVEDVKSTFTRKEKDYVLRRKMMYFLKGIYVTEVIV